MNLPNNDFDEPRRGDPLVVKRRPLLVNDVVAERVLLIGDLYFQCPHCGRLFGPRGGGKEGFVKSGANNHVSTCYEVLLYLAGYVFGEYVVVKIGKWKQRANGLSERHDKAGHVARPIAEATVYQRRRIKANVNKRRREGVLGRLQEQIDALPKRRLRRRA